MLCAEHFRLKKIYDEAEHAWSRSQQLVLNGAFTIETSHVFRKGLRQSRLKAAKELYDHYVNCPNCKRSLVTSVAGDRELHQS